MKKIPLKNYLIVLILSVATVFLTFYFANNYKKNKIVQKINFLSEIKQNELNSYISERSDVIIFMTYIDNDDLIKNLKKYLKENELKSEFVYIDLNEVNNNFYNEFYVNYVNEASNKSFEIKNSTLVFIENGTINSYINNIKYIEQVKNFFESNELIDD